MSTQTQPYTGSRFSAKTLTMCAIFTALVAVCSQITIPLPIIPINLALFAVYLAGALLGPWRGALSLVVYLLLAAVGVPVMAGFRGGLGNLVGNTGGYVVGYIFAAFFTGLLAVKWGSKFWQLCVAMVLGCAVCYFFGTLWYSILSGTPFFVSFSQLIKALSFSSNPAVMTSESSFVCEAWIYLSIFALLCSSRLPLPGVSHTNTVFGKL